MSSSSTSFKRVCIGRPRRSSASMSSIGWCCSHRHRPVRVRPQRSFHSLFLGQLIVRQTPFAAQWPRNPSLHPRLPCLWKTQGGCRMPVDSLISIYQKNWSFKSPTPFERCCGRAWRWFYRAVSVVSMPNQGSHPNGFCSGRSSGCLCDLYILEFFLFFLQPYLSLLTLEMLWR